MKESYNFLILAKQYLFRFTKFYFSHLISLFKINFNNIVNKPKKNHQIFINMVKENQLSRENINTYNLIKKNKFYNELIKINIDEKFFSDLEAIILFIGYSRSGHSLVGSLLDAHPEILISHELHFMKHLLSGVTVNNIAESIVINSAIFNKNGREYTGYDYSIDGQYQGKVKRLKILGDKKGNGTIRIIRKYPEVLTLLDKFNVPVKFIHVIRNPYDNIATRAKRNNTSLRFAAKGYFKNMEVITRITQNTTFEVQHVLLEDLIYKPEATLNSLITSLDLERPTENYLNACKGRLFSKPKETRFDYSWDPMLVNFISRKIKHYEFLKRFQHRPF